MRLRKNDELGLINNIISQNQAIFPIEIIFDFGALFIFPILFENEGLTILVAKFL